MTVTTALPPNVAGQRDASEAETNVYVVVTDGLTGMVKLGNGEAIGAEVVVPSEYVKDHGAVPVKVTVRFIIEPSQMVVVPEIVAVGVGVTVITALPVMLGLGAVTAQSVTVLVTLTIVYVVFAVGLTPTVAPVLIPFALKLVVPSV